MSSLSLNAHRPCCWFQGSYWMYFPELIRADIGVYNMDCKPAFKVCLNDLEIYFPILCACNIDC